MHGRPGNWQRIVKGQSAFSKGCAAWGGGYEPVPVGCDRLRRPACGRCSRVAADRPVYMAASAGSATARPAGGRELQSARKSRPGPGSAPGPQASERKRQSGLPGMGPGWAETRARKFR
jgi:hypothetical protein